MRQSWAAGFLITVACAAVAGLNVGESRAAPETPVVRLCYEDVDAPPWRYRRGGGLDVQLLERAAKRAGVSFQYETMPWQSCLARLRANQIDGVFGQASLSEESGSRDGDAGPGHALDHRQRLGTGNSSYLLLSDEVARRRTELSTAISQSIEAVRASASYRILERHTLALLGGHKNLTNLE